MLEAYELAQRWLSEQWRSEIGPFENYLTSSLRLTIGRDAVRDQQRTEDIEAPAIQETISTPAEDLPEVDIEDLITRQVPERYRAIARMVWVEQCSLNIVAKRTGHALRHIKRIASHTRKLCLGQKKKL